MLVNCFCYVISDISTHRTKDRDLSDFLGTAPGTAGTPEVRASQGVRLSESGD